MLKLFVALLFFRTPKAAESSDGCRIGPLPNGWIESAIPPFAKLALGDYVNTSTSVIYKCNDNYLLDGPVFNTCFMKKWVSAAPNCNCNSIDVRHFGEAAPCTVAGIRTPAEEDFPTKCGKVTQTLTKTPWNVDFIHPTIDRFLGTIINARVVISTAMKFWNLTEQKVNDLREYRVQIVRQNFLHKQLEVERVVFPPNLGKHLKLPLSANIALVGLGTSIEFKSYVVPICLPFKLPLDSLISSNFKGRTPQQEHVELKLPKSCFSEWNTADRELTAIDSLCTNRLKLKEDDLIEGSSFAIPLEKGGIEKFYLIGVQTFYRKTDQGIFFEFQNLLYYKDFLQNAIPRISFLTAESHSSAPISPEECSVACGIVSQSGVNTPWDVLIINQVTNAYISGTIVSARLVLSVARHFWNKAEQKAYDSSEFYVSIVLDNVIQQQIEAERIVFGPNHNKFLELPPSGNIVGMHLRSSISFKSGVSPICLPFELSADAVIRNSLRGRTPQQDNIELQLPTRCSSVTGKQAADIYCTSRLKLNEGDITEGSSFAVPITQQGSEVFYLFGLRTWIHTTDNRRRTFFDFQNVLFYKDFIQNEISNDWKKRCEAPNTTGETLSHSCRANIIPDRGDAYYEANDQRVEFGEIIENSVSIIYRCIENHIVFGNSTNICLNGEWLFPKPECRPRCSPNEIQGWTLIANCQYQEGNVTRETSCSEPATPGTIASLNCQRGYQRFGSHQQTSTCGLNGRWYPLPEKCTPVCGEIGHGAAYIVGGETTEILKVPWHAGIYRQHINNQKPEQICGGSIITAKIVVSAMHCFWDSTEDKVRNQDEFDVAVGKCKRKFEAAETLKPQFFKIESIFYEPGYNDYAGNYANDIAIVVLNNFIEFKSYIAPVCIDFGLEYDDKIVQPGLIGKVAGWGLEETSGTPSPLLKEIELPIVSRTECTEQSTTAFRPFITSDKFCAGYLTGIGVCQGDSGGGLVISKINGLKTVYSLRGIVSSGPSWRGSCDHRKYTTFTNVGYYSDLIKKYYLKYQPNL